MSKYGVFMRFLWGKWLCLCVCLMGCSQSKDEEMEEVGKIVLIEEESPSWERLEEGYMQGNSQEFSFSEEASAQ